MGDHDLRVSLTRRDLLMGISSGVALAAGGRRFATASTEPAPIILRAQAGSAPLAPSLSGETDTLVWAYNGVVPGPTLRCRQGEKLHVRLVNELNQPTSIHWHGVRIDNTMDGVPGLTQEDVAPGGEFDYEFLAPDAGSYWFHTHSRAWDQMARGLYGLLIVEEAIGRQFDRDIYLAIDDWYLTPEGQLETETLGDLHEWGHGGRLGNWLTVNGRRDPELPIGSGERVRLRLVNTANARVFDISFGETPLLVIAYDGHPVAPSKLQGRPLSLSPGQRIDLLLDATGRAGERIEIREVSGDAPLRAASLIHESVTSPGGRAGQPFDGLAPWIDDTRFDFGNAVGVNLSMAGGAMGTMDRAIVDGKMREWPELIDLKRVWAFNGVAGDMDAPLLDVARGTSVTVNIINETNWPHAMHLHGQHFKVLARNGQSRAGSPWRDTELVEPLETVRIGFVASNPGKWLLHCHMLEHQASGMTTWIEVRA